jgi:Limiting CO2-inducible proteins B/C beta carbonyic anhydrases
LCVGMAHIGVLPDGTLGACHRPGMVNAEGESIDSPACGALCFLEERLAERKGDARSLADGDTEFNLLVDRVTPSLDRDNPPSIAELTKLTAGFVHEDLIRVARQVIQDPSRQQCLLVSGVQIHAPNGVELVAPGMAREVAVLLLGDGVVHCLVYSNVEWNLLCGEVERERTRKRVF